MNQKKNAVFTIAFPAAVFLIFTLADLLHGDRIFSETENRVLASRPAFSSESLFSGEYTAALEKYLTDQFVGRDKWIRLKTETDLLMQHQEIGGVYLSKEDYLIEQHLPGDYPEQQTAERLKLLDRLVQEWNASVMLVPTADNILQDKMPANAPCYDQAALLERVSGLVGEERCVDVYGALQEHSSEQIYYRTDHHWTSLGAYYGYLAWADAMGEAPYSYDVEGMETVSENFLGTLQSKVNLDWPADSIRYFPETRLRRLEVTYDLQTETDTLYAEKYLNTKDQYGFFLDGNHGVTEIDLPDRGKKTLFLIKDSYANCFVPLLLPHYDRIYVMDLRYFNGRLFDFMKACEPEEGMDVLVLYNCIHFLEEFQYY